MTDELRNYVVEGAKVRVEQIQKEKANLLKQFPELLKEVGPDDRALYMRSFREGSTTKG